MKRLIPIFILSLLIISCAGEYGNESIILDIENNEPNRIIKNFYKRNKLEKDEFKRTVGLYSKLLRFNKLKRVAYKDGFNFGKKERNGYIYLDQNNNFVASITFKYVMLQDSSYEINFIDFRNNTNGIPCIKFPSRFPIKCVALPNPVPPSKTKSDSIKAIYPTNYNGFEFYHTHQIKRSDFVAKGDSLKRVISFNNGNRIIKDNLINILKEIDNTLGLEYYTLSEMNKIGEHVINITYDPKIHTDHEISTLKLIIANNTNSRVVLKKHKTMVTSWGYVEPMITIGFALSEARVRF